jgi:cell division protein ZapA
MEETNATTVEIFGREYKIKGADQDYVREIAKYVDGKMKEVAQGTTLPSQDRLAILAAMHIADELFQYKREQSDKLISIEHKTESLISLLDEGLQTGE